MIMLRDKNMDWFNVAVVIVGAVYGSVIGSLRFKNVAAAETIIEKGKSHAI